MLGGPVRGACPVTNSSLDGVKSCCLCLDTTIIPFPVVSGNGMGQERRFWLESLVRMSAKVISERFSAHGCPERQSRHYERKIGAPAFA